MKIRATMNKTMAMAMVADGLYRGTEVDRWLVNDFDMVGCTSKRSIKVRPEALNFTGRRTTLEGRGLLHL